MLLISQLLVEQLELLVFQVDILHCLESQFFQWQPSLVEADLLARLIVVEQVHLPQVEQAAVVLFSLLEKRLVEPAVFVVPTELVAGFVVELKLLSVLELVLLLQPLDVEPLPHPQGEIQ